MKGDIVKAWTDADKARLLVRVEDGFDAEGKPRYLEIAGSAALLDEQGLPKDDGALKADLLADVRRALDAEPGRRPRPAPQELPWSGEVEL